MKYFGHDCNAGDDPKLIKVRLKYGITGYGVYFRCLEFIGTKMSEQCRDCVLEPDLELLEHDFHLPQQKIKDILEYLVEVGLFDKTKEGKYRNLKLWDRKDEYTEKRARKMEGQGKANVPTVSRQGKDNVPLKEKKVKESKRKEKKPALQNLKVEGVLQPHEIEALEKTPLVS
jgi:Domain of unknown function (DUF4373)